MNIRQLQAFRAVMLAGTVTRAAELLHLTQPTVSKLIADLEYRTELTLFERSNGRLLPRLEAHRLLEQIERVFAAIEDVERNARQLARGQAGHLRIIAIPALALDFLPQAVASFTSTRPDVTIELNTRPANRVVEWIVSGQADLGFASDVPMHGGTEMQQFQSLEGVCVLPPNHWLAQKTVLEPVDFEGERFISLGRDTAFRHHIDRVFEEARVARRIVIETGYSATACSMVRDGAGIAIVDPITAAARHYSSELVIRQFLPRVSFTTHAVFARNAPRPILAEEFLTHLSELAKPLQ